MEREEEEEEKVFVCSLAYSTLMDSSGTTDQDEKTSIEEASTSGASSGSGSESPGSPTPLVSERVVDVSQNGLSFTTVRHSPLFRTRLPHLSAHSLALTAGNRKQRYSSPYVPSGQYAQPQSYDKWSKQRSKTSKWTRRRRLERPLLWLATAILILLLIAGIMIAVFWVSGSGSDKGGEATVLLPNATNTTTSTTTTIPGLGVITTNLSMTSLLTKLTSLPTAPTPSTSPPSTTRLKATTSTTTPSTTTSTTTPATTTILPTTTLKTTATSTLKTTASTTTLPPTTTTISTTTKAAIKTSSSPSTSSSTTPSTTLITKTATTPIPVYILTARPSQTRPNTTTPASNTLPSNVVPAVPDTNITPAGDLPQELADNNATEKPP